MQNFSLQFWTLTYLFTCCTHARMHARTHAHACTHVYINKHIVVIFSNVLESIELCIHNRSQQTKKAIHCILSNPVSTNPNGLRCLHGNHCGFLENVCTIFNLSIMHLIATINLSEAEGNNLLF